MVETMLNERLGAWLEETPNVAKRICGKVAEAALGMLGVDLLGLDGQDRKYIETIHRVFHGGPVGVEAVAHTLNTAIDTLTDEVEPFLLRAELVVRTPRGRKLTTKGYEHLGVTPPRRLAPPLRGSLVDRVVVMKDRGDLIRCTDR